MNPFLDYTAAEFLRVYAALITITLLLVGWRRRLVDGSRERPDLATTQASDPYLVAYLRGGNHELARVAVVSLVKRGHLSIDRDVASRRERWTISSAAPFAPTRHVRQDAVDRVVLKWFAAPLRADAPDWRGLARTLESAALPYHEFVQREQLVTSDDARHARVRAAIGAAALIAATGGIRMVVGLQRGRPIGFLILLCVVGVTAALLLARSPRLSHRGRRLLNSLRSGEAHRDQVPHYGHESSSVTAAAIFGLAALTDTQFAPLQKTRESGDTGVSFFGDVGSSGSGGDGGGSGCGGGGCGGCGGS